MNNIRDVFEGRLVEKLVGVFEQIDDMRQKNKERDQRESKYAMHNERQALYSLKLAARDWVNGTLSFKDYRKVRATLIARWPNLKRTGR